MTDQWCGSLVTIDCGEILGTYEGEVTNVDSNNQLISLTNVKKNSVKCPTNEVTLRSKDIKNLQILKSAASRPNTVIKQTNESAFAQPLLTKKSNKIDSPVQDDNSKKKDPRKKTPSKRNDMKRWQTDRDEACFSAPVDQDVFNTEFDFEKNLALFDKRAVFDEINALTKFDQSVRLVDCNKRSQPKYRHDENVLDSGTPVLKHISVPCISSREYVTDSGLLVPSVSKEFRESLFKKAEELGLSTEVRLEMTGRAASEMVLHLLGGNHRLNPQNSHQRPTVVVLCGYHTQGVQGLICGRHLANHQTGVTVMCPAKETTFNKWFPKELHLFSLTGGTKCSEVSELPSTVDIIVSCLESLGSSEEANNTWIKSVRNWAKACKAPILCLDPQSKNCSLTCKWVLWPVLPFINSNKECSVYICDIGLPKDIFTQSDCSYSSPFGSKFIIPLYTKKA